MNYNRFRAIQLVVKLVTVFHISLIDACRIAGTRESVDSDWLYREMTS